MPSCCWRSQSSVSAQKKMMKRRAVNRKKGKGQKNDTKMQKCRWVVEESDEERDGKEKKKALKLAIISANVPANRNLECKHTEMLVEILIPNFAIPLQTLLNGKTGNGRFGKHYFNACPLKYCPIEDPFFASSFYLCPPTFHSSLSVKNYRSTKQFKPHRHTDTHFDVLAFKREYTSSSSFFHCNCLLVPIISH